ACFVAEDNAGNIWFAKAGQVGVFENGRFETKFHVPGTAVCVSGAAGGGLWAASNSHLFRYREGEVGDPIDCGRFTATNAVTEVTAMIEDAHGAVWIGTSDAGL